MMRNILLRILLMSLLMTATVGAQAQDEERNQFLFDMDGGLNTDGYEVNIGISWWPVQGFGLKMAIGISSEIEEISDWAIWDDYYGYDYGYDYGYGYDDYTVRFKFMPSIMLKSPAIAKWSEGEYRLSLFANPGICLSPGAAGSRDADWFYWQIRGGLMFELDEQVVIGLGYGRSNFNLYSGNPQSHHGLPNERDRRTDSVFLNLGFRF